MAVKICFIFVIIIISCYIFIFCSPVLVFSIVIVFADGRFSFYFWTTPTNCIIRVTTDCLFPYIESTSPFTASSHVICSDGFVIFSPITSWNALGFVRLIIADIVRNNKTGERHYCCKWQNDSYDFLHFKVCLLYTIDPSVLILIICYCSTDEVCTQKERGTFKSSSDVLRSSTTYYPQLQRTSPRSTRERRRLVWG